MKILALDLGKFKSVYVMYVTESKEQSYENFTILRTLQLISTPATRRKVISLWN